MLEPFIISSWGSPPVPHAAGEPEVEVEVVQRVVLVRRAAAGQRQAGDLAAQPVAPLQVQGAVGPVLLPSREAGVVDGHVGYTIKPKENKSINKHDTGVNLWKWKMFFS